MTQPSFVPIDEADQVRGALHLQVPADWRQDRPAEIVKVDKVQGDAFGSPGPDQGYALLIAEELYGEKLKLTPGETAEDALEGASAIASARSALFGRAPVGKDVELGLVLFGFLGDPPAELVEWRVPQFKSVSHHYSERRKLVDRVPESTLRLTVPQITAKLSDWKSLFNIS